MGCCHPIKTPVITNTIPVPYPTPVMPPTTPFRSSERPSLRRQGKPLNIPSGVAHHNDITITENVTIVDGTALRRQSENYLSETLKEHFFFHSISDVDRREIIKQMYLCEVKPHTYIFKQNDMASAFFIIHEGSVQVEIGGEPKKTLSRGNYFGELALLYASPRSASIKTL